MNCSLCGLPQDTDALGSVLPQCICHWKHTPYQGTRQTELNAGGEPVKNATYWKRQYNHLLMKLNTSALKIAELEKKLQESALDYISVCSQADEHYARLQELEKQLDIHFKNGFESGKLEGWKAHKYHSTPQTKPLSDDEIKVLKEIIRISDRKHPLWDKAKEFLK